MLLKKFKPENGYTFRNFYLPLLGLISATSLLLTFQITIGFGEIEYRRLIRYTVVFSPFLVGLFLWNLNQHLRIGFKKTWVKSIALASVLFMCICFSLIQVFPYQPLVPKADVLSRDLPQDMYILDLMVVNTIYQEKMISFAERFSPSDFYITSDRVTRWQIFGFANPSFSSRHVWGSPLDPNMSNEDEKWDIFLLHYGERSGPLNEKVEYRTREAIEELRDTLGNVIYDNGESFIIAH